jgi:hypothetical protein
LTRPTSHQKPRNKANESTSPDAFMAFIMPAPYIALFHDWEHHAICSAACFRSYQFWRPRRLLTLALISWRKVGKSLYDGKLLTMCPPWSALLAWEGHCKSHFIVLGVSHTFQGGDYVVAMATTTSAGFVEQELLYVKPTTILRLLRRTLSCRSA